MILTQQQQLACQAAQIQKWLGCSQTSEMACLIAIFAQIAGISVTCAELQSLSAQFNCLQRQTQLPALIYLAQQIVANQPPLGAGWIMNFTSNGTGAPPAFTPQSGAGMAYDTSTGIEWTYNGTGWQ